MNKLKRVLCGTLALAMAASMMAACGGDDSSSSGSGNSGDNSGSNGDKKTVKVYTFTEETQTMLDIFKKDEANKAIVDKYDFDIVLEATASNYITKVASALSSDADAPDLFLADADYAQQFAAYENTASLADLGITLNESDYYTYVLDFTSVDGVRKGVSHQAAAGAVLYRRDLAEEVLGSGEPEEVQKAMSDWTKFEETAGKMKEKGYYMISGIDELKRCFMNNRDGAWVQDGKYYCDTATVTQYLELTKRLADAGSTNFVDKTQWTSNWYNGMNGTSNVFCYFGCTWYLHYTIKPNCVLTKTGEADKDGNATTAEADYVDGNGTFGKWGLIPGPAGYFWGGTWWFGSKQSTSRGTSEAVKAVIEYFCVNDASMEAYMKQTGDFPSKKTVADKLTSDTTSSTYKFLAGQDHYTLLKDAADKINVKTCSQYDDTFNTALDDATVAFVGGTSLEDVLQDIEDAAASAGFTVE